MRTLKHDAYAQAVGRTRVLALSAMVLLAVLTTFGHADDRIDLSGTWHFRVDPDDLGIEEEWFIRQLPDSIKLPGSLQEQGFGNDVDLQTKWTGGIVDRSFFDAPRYERYRQPENFKIPFWLQPLKHYVGPAWYRRTVTLPDAWYGKRVVLRLERCHWETTVWADDRQIGSQDSLAAPHEYDMTSALVPGPTGRKAHTLTIRVDNRIKDINVGPNSHSVADHTQTNWNGMIGRIELRATDRVWIDDVQVFPDVSDNSAHVRVRLGNLTRGGGRGTLTADAVAVNTASPHDPAPKTVPLVFGPGEETLVEFDYTLGDQVQLWDEFRPTLYRLSLALDAGTGEVHHRARATVVFGMREITTRDTQFILNGRPAFLRGTLECCIFPLTGYPPTDVEPWKRIIRVCQAHGLNHMRFHSHCPPEAAFVAADELGFYFQVECGSWANQGASVGNGEPLDKWLYEEADRILEAYGNHPSFLLMAYGNEPAGPERGGKYLRPWVTHYRQKDSRRVYTSAAGWPIIPENQYHNTPEPRIHAWGSGLGDRINGKPPATTADYGDYAGQFDVPVVSHEIGQWCVYPNFDEIPKYTGVLKAKNFEVFRDFLEQSHMGDQAHDFLMASGKLQALCYKEEIESALRTPRFGGFQLLDLHDFPGQGSALVGVLDPLWDSKPYVTPEEFRRFCNHTVPLVRLQKRVFVDGEPLEAAVEVYQFGPDDLDDAVVAWKLLRGDGRAAASGTFPPRRLPKAQLTEVGSISAKLPTTGSPQKLRLVAAIEGTPFENDWDVWTYPESVDTTPPEHVLIAQRLDDETLARLTRGGNVLLASRPSAVRGDVVIGFSPVFWNTAWTRNQPPHTLGILCDPKHPALERFPTEYHTNWQWWELISRSGAMVLDDLPPKLRPIVQVIDTWFAARRLGLMFEARVGGGKLLVCSMDITNDLDSRPVARQMRRSILAYMASDQFNPETHVDIDAIRGLFRPLSNLERLEATVVANSAQRGYEAQLAIDGNAGTIWHTAWEPTRATHPHELVVDLGQPFALAGLTYLPRQDMSNGRIAKYAVYMSTDGKDWGKPVVGGEWPEGPKQKKTSFSCPVTARYVKLVALSETKGQPYASAAEVDVLLAEQSSQD